MDRDAINLPSYLGLDDKALLAQCVVDIYRASGPGGQKRNKTGSAIRLRHQPTGINITAVESRSQHENRARALKRLRQGIALHVRRPVNPDGYKPSPLLLTCLSGEGRLSVGRRDFRYHAAVWEILDLLAACGVQIATTAACLGVTTAHLVHFLRGDTALWRRVNEMRLAAGQKHLK